MDSWMEPRVCERNAPVLIDVIIELGSTVLEENELEGAITLLLYSRAVILYREYMPPVTPGIIDAAIFVRNHFFETDNQHMHHEWVDIVKSMEELRTWEDPSPYESRQQRDEHLFLQLGVAGVAGNEVSYRFDGGFISESIHGLFGGGFFISFQDSGYKVPVTALLYPCPDSTYRIAGVKRGYVGGFNIRYGFQESENYFLDALGGVSIVNKSVITQSEVTGHHYYQSSRTVFRFLPGLGITHVAGYLFETFSPVIQVFYQSSMGFGLSLGITER